MEKSSKQRILIAGATGFVGQALCAELAKDGHELHILSRDAHAASRMPVPCKVWQWTKTGAVPPGAIEGIDAVINLAGESVMGGRWTKERKAKLRQSRVAPTRALATAIAQATAKPRILIQTSAMGFYGDTDDRAVDEAAPAGSDFLADLCVEWEAAAAPVTKHGVRLARMRLGLVFGKTGGAFPAMRRAYRLGVGVVPGRGEQWVSWVHIKDVIAAYVEALRDERYEGAFNVVAPDARRFVELHRALTGRSSGPVLKAPESLIRLAMGEASSMLLSSCHVVPRHLSDLGFHFSFGDLPSALSELLSTAKSSEPKLPRQSPGPRTGKSAKDQEDPKRMPSPVYD